MYRGEGGRKPRRAILLLHGARRHAGYCAMKTSVVFSSSESFFFVFLFFIFRHGSSEAALLVEYKYTVSTLFHVQGPEPRQSFFT